MIDPQKPIIIERGVLHDLAERVANVRNHLYGNNGGSEQTEELEHVRDILNDLGASQRNKDGKRTKPGEREGLYIPPEILHAEEADQAVDLIMETRLHAG